MFIVLKSFGQAFHFDLSLEVTSVAECSVCLCTLSYCEVNNFAINKHLETIPYFLNKQRMVQ